jgi:hypothetical protein
MARGAKDDAGLLSRRHAVETRRRARRTVTVGALGDKWWEQAS